MNINEKVELLNKEINNVMIAKKVFAEKLEIARAFDDEREIEDNLRMIEHCDKKIDGYNDKITKLYDDDDIYTLIDELKGIVEQQKAVLAKIQAIVLPGPEVVNAK